MRARKVVAYRAVKPDVENAGATCVGAEVVVGENLVASGVRPNLPAWMRELIKPVKEGSKS